MSKSLTEDQERARIANLAAEVDLKNLGPGSLRKLFDEYEATQRDARKAKENHDTAAQVQLEARHDLEEAQKALRLAGTKLHEALQKAGADLLK